MHLLCMLRSVVGWLRRLKPYYEQDGIAIYHGDCRDVLPALGPVDHVMTDPPYSDDTHEGARTTGDEKGGVVLIYSRRLSPITLRHHAAV